MGEPIWGAEDESKVLGYGFVWLADVLRAIGDEAAC
jgi:hypothetical protein